MVISEAKMDVAAPDAVTGEFVTIDGVRCYAIHNVDRMPPFFVSVVSASDHWLFVSSSGGLTAGRVSPKSALFPYMPVDRIHECGLHTGSKTIVRTTSGGRRRLWEPFNIEHDGRYEVSRNLYKSVSGDSLCFEEINHDLLLSFHYTWKTSDLFGFVRQCELRNLDNRPVKGELLDGLQNILPAGTPATVQANASNLVDAYKWNELDTDSGLAVYTLYSGITDRATPCESLRASSVFCLGLPDPKILLSSTQVNSFRKNELLEQESLLRGVRGAFFVNSAYEIEPQECLQWNVVADVEKTQAQVVSLQNELRSSRDVNAAIADSVAEGTDSLMRAMASTDALQLTAEDDGIAHHYANVLFNDLRGGVIDDQYDVSSRDFIDTVRHFNRPAYETNQAFLRRLPAKLRFSSLLGLVREQRDTDLERLCREYMPIRFGRRHGDPSRPWNQFSIQLKGSDGDRLLSYEGNWRDIFQNWEALTFSYPRFIENVIAKFVNASTIDGHNPYRISKDGIDWEVEDPEDPWTYIGYWGDHQLIYLLKFLEMSTNFNPGELPKLLRRPVFCYANVPYRIRPLDALLRDPKTTVEFDHDLSRRISKRVADKGADGKLVLDTEGRVYHVNLLEKLLIPVLAKLGNFVVDGGIWLNTQRPEWNDANNALAGHGLSMVTLCYLRRYLSFLRELLANEAGAVELSIEVSQWLEDTAAALSKSPAAPDCEPIAAGQRFASIVELGRAASDYRERVYGETPFSGKTAVALDSITMLVRDALVLVDRSIASNRRDDGLYHAYNILALDAGAAEVESLYPMLEGQVAVLSAGLIDAEQSCAILEALFESEIYRPDQKSFMLYPDRNLPAFLEKNVIPPGSVDNIPLLLGMVAEGDRRIVSRDAQGTCRFSPELVNIDALESRLDELASEYGNTIESARAQISSLYESVFNHRAFTGRSGSMFGFEGLGCIYWHMVSKLLLAVQENYFAAVGKGADPEIRKRLGGYYYRIREGLGFNKSPAEYGAFPMDPYSHTPKHAGAQQPGMTGQVKEEILTRFGELGISAKEGRANFRPELLRACEFLPAPGEFRHLDTAGNWRTLQVPANALAFTWCQVPVVYALKQDAKPSLSIINSGGERYRFSTLELPAAESAELFGRTGNIRRITVTISPGMLFDDVGAGNT